MLPLTNPVAVFALVAVLILLAPIIMGRWRLPGMMGLLMAGALLGPNAFGVLARDQSFVLFGTVGLLYIMFTAALEIDMAVLKRYRTHSLIFGVLTFVIPMSLGIVVGRLLGFSWPAAILLASMFASHTLLTYPIASRLGIARNQAVTTAVGGTIITDSLALLVLAVIAGMTRGEMDEFFWQRLFLSLTVYVAVILFGVPVLARWFLRHVARDGVAEFAFVLATVFTCAALSTLAGSEPIVGAFLAGLALNRLIPHNSTLMNRIQFTGDALFIPFFLLSVGMLLDVRVFASSPEAWVVAAGMVMTVFAAKWLAAECTRPLLNYSRAQAKVVFGLSVPQAAATLAATMVGYEIGLFNDAVVNGAVLMILVTCFIAPIIVDRYGRRLVSTEATDALVLSGTQHRLLVGCSSVSSATPMMALAVMLREPAHQQPIHALTVINDSEDPADPLLRGERLLAELEGQLASFNVPMRPITRVDLNTASGILRTRRDIQATMTIVGWHQTRLGAEMLFGSFVEQLLQDKEYHLLVAHLTGPLSVCRRLVLVVPPYAELEESIVVALSHVLRLVAQLKLDAVMLCDRKHEAALKQRFAGIRGAADMTIRSDSWNQTQRTLFQLADNEQLVVFVDARPGGYGRLPLLGGLPDRLIRHFPGMNVLVWYLKTAAQATDVVPSNPSSL